MMRTSFSQNERVSGNGQDVMESGTLQRGCIIGMMSVLIAERAGGEPYFVFAYHVG